MSKRKSKSYNNHLQAMPTRSRVLSRFPLSYLSSRTPRTRKLGIGAEGWITPFIRKNKRLNTMESVRTGATRVTAPRRVPLYTPVDLDVAKICADRKARREVLFAKGKQGGNHKPATYTFKSLVRCS